MLSIRDCLDYCDLQEDLVSLFAEQEKIPAQYATYIVCGLVQTSEGVCLISSSILRAIEDFLEAGQPKEAARALKLYEYFISAHPTSS